MSQVVVNSTLASNLADGGTVAVTYPTGYDESMFALRGHKVVPLNGKTYVDGVDFTVAFGDGAATVTWQAADTLLAGTSVYFELAVKGDNEVDLKRTFGVGNVTPVSMVEINLGAPDVADANGYVESQNLTALGVFSADVTAAAAIAAAALAGTADVPRNVVAAWTGTAVLTVTGTDEYGNTVVESSASGTSLAGKKAFKTITNISSNANITALTVGTGDVLGLPMYLPDTARVLIELEDDAAPAAGTTVAGSAAEPTATTGDIRGTYDPNSACDGAARFSLVVALNEPEFKGGSQFAG